MIRATMKKMAAIALAALTITSAATESHAILIPIALTPDAANSSVSGFNGSLAFTVNDTFAYNINNPNSPLPDQSFSGSAGTSQGFHAQSGTASDGIDVFLSYNFTNGPITIQGPGQSFFIDLYGRTNCCTNRDNNIDIQVFSGGVTGTLIGTLFGVNIPDATQRIRVDLAPVIPAGVSFNAIRLVGHDSDGAGNGNSFTLMEIRAALSIPEPATASLALLGLAGLMARRRRLA